MLYTLAVARNFVAEHFLIGGDWGDENRPHSHSYRLEVRLEGETLNEHGYLLDIVEFDALLDDFVAYYRDHRLNDLPEFEQLNPSLEHFARILCLKISDALETPSLCAVQVRLWEDDVAWASYRKKRPCT
jgi:6-pyruvoyltetrahydropterin/6-carboxytetrahydropterin synthase